MLGSSSRPRIRSVISRDTSSHDETAARTRPFSFDQIMSRRQKKKLLEVEKDGGAVENVSDHVRSDRGDGASRDANAGVEERVLDKRELDEREKEKVGKKENDYRGNGKDREVRDTKMKVEERKDLRVEDKRNMDKRYNDRRKRDELRSNDARNEVGKDEGAFRSKLGDGGLEKVPHCVKSDRSDGRGREAYTGVEELVKGKKVNDSSVNVKDRGFRETELKIKERKDPRADNKDKIDRKYHDKRKRDELQGNDVRNEASRNWLRDVTEKDRYTVGSGKYDRESRRMHQNGVEWKKRDRNGSRGLESEKRHHAGLSERKERKLLSKPHKEETVHKRRRSRSTEQGYRNRKSISPSLRGNQHASYHRREHVDMSSNKEGSEQQHNDEIRNRTIDDGLRSHYRRPSGTSGLGGYSPRKRKTEAAVKSPSPAKQTKEKKSSKKWDIAPEGMAGSLSTPISSNLQQSNQLVTVPTASTIVKPMPVIPSLALSAIRNASIDSVQLTQATRPMRRLYVENIPASASEKEVMEFLNGLLVSSRVNHIQGTQPCISCIVHKEKGQALVEFLTPEDASAALSFDGGNFSGATLKIRRPKDYVEVTTGEPGKSVAAFNASSEIVKDSSVKTVEPEKLAASVDAISNSVEGSPHKIFIGGISKLISSKMLMDIAIAFGPLKAYQFEEREGLNETYAFLEYADQSVTSKACAGLNGLVLGGQVITVVQAIPNSSSLEHDGHLKARGIPEHAKPLLEKPTNVLKLKNVFVADALSSLPNGEIREVLEDVRLECSRFGAIKSINVVKDNGSPVSTSEAGEAMAHVTEQNFGNDETDFRTKNKTSEGAVIASQEKNISAGNDRRASDNESDGHGQRMSNDIPAEDHSTDNKLTAEELLNSEEVGADTKTTTRLENSTVDRKLDAEIGSVLVEFVRAEAACMAAHCLHGRSFDDRIVSVEYVPYEIYEVRFGK